MQSRFVKQWNIQVTVAGRVQLNGWTFRRVFCWNTIAKSFKRRRWTQVRGPTQKLVQIILWWIVLVLFLVTRLIPRLRTRRRGWRVFVLITLRWFRFRSIMNVSRRRRSLFQKLRTVSGLTFLETRLIVVTLRVSKRLLSFRRFPSRLIPRVGTPGFSLVTVFRLFLVTVIQGKRLFPAFIVLFLLGQVPSPTVNQFIPFVVLFILTVRLFLVTRRVPALIGRFNFRGTRRWFRDFAA